MLLHHASDVNKGSFLVFEDGATFEFYGEAFSCAAGVDVRQRSVRYIEAGGGEVTAIY